MNDEIEGELKNRMIHAGLSMELPVAYPNVEFEPPADGSGFIDFQMVWADAQDLSLKSSKDVSGRLVLVLAMPLNGGTLKSLGFAKELAELYPKNLRLPLPSGGHVRISNSPSIRTGYRDGLYWRTPIVVPFQSMVA